MLCRFLRVMAQHNRHPLLRVAQSRTALQPRLCSALQMLRLL